MEITFMVVTAIAVGAALLGLLVGRWWVLAVPLVVPPLPFLPAEDPWPSAPGWALTILSFVLILPGLLGAWAGIAAHKRRAARARPEL